MKNKIKYSNEPIEARVINDFLPSPEDLSLNEKKTKDREVKGLVACAKEFKLNEGLIITRNYEGTEKIDDIKVNFIPLWKWLLSQ